MAISNPYQISESALKNFYARFTDASKGFNAQYAIVRANYPLYNLLPSININYNLTTSAQLIEGAYDLDTLFDILPGITFPAFQYFAPNARNLGEEKNHTFGGRIPVVLMVHLNYPDKPPTHQLNGRISLLANAIEDTIFAMYATPGTLNTGAGNYQNWPNPKLAPNTLVSQRTDIIKGARGLAQGLRFDMLWDLQTSA